MKHFYISKKSIVCGVLLTCALLLYLTTAPVSCKLGGNGLELHVITATSPQLESYKTVSPGSMTLTFDKPVTVECAAVYAGSSQSPENSMDASAQDTQPAQTIQLDFSGKTELAKPYTLSARVKDGNGDTLALKIHFTGFNDHKPKLIICEIRNAYSSKKNKYEFVKLYCLQGGNLSGLELASAGDGKDKSYRFPPIEVKQGQYITVHLRRMKNEDGTFTQDGMTDETNGIITESTATDASSLSWDFWVDNQKSRISPSDIIVLQDSADSSIMDAVMFMTPKGEAESLNQKYAKACAAVEQSGLWLDADGTESGDFTSAFIAQGITSAAVTRSIRRRQLTAGPSSARDWYVASSR